MCLIAWNWQPDSNTPLLLLGNRDEFYARPTQTLHWWEDTPILAGKDLQAGGTWLGVGPNGRLAALTNHRQPATDNDLRPSRGELTTRFLEGEWSAHDYLSALAAVAGQYNPFNLLVWDGHTLLGLESRHGRIVQPPPGIGAVSNADFDTPWPKLQRLKAGLLHQCQSGQTTANDLLPLLQDRTLAADKDLPETGVALDLERLLSAPFIASTHYGTRASSIVRIGQRHVSFFEQAYENGEMGVTTQHSFDRSGG